MSSNFRSRIERAGWCSFVTVALVTSAQAHAASEGASPLLDELLEIDAAHGDLCGAGLDEEAARRRIVEMAEAVRVSSDIAQQRRPQASDVTKAALRSLNGIIFGPAGLRSSHDVHDPCNLLLSSVLSRRQGYCVGVAAVYLAVAERLGLPARAVGTPTHVFLRYDDGLTRINIDTDGGTTISDEEYARRLGIPDESIRKGVFLGDLTNRRFLAQVRNNLGVLYSERQELPKAEAEYRAAIDLDRKLPSAWYNRGKVYFELGRFDEAVRSFDRALRLYPTDLWALNNRALSLSALGRFDDARMDLNRALSLDPTFEPAKQNLARLSGAAHQE
jgi:regulator of sirC expression with transglutaminase-like and TPR domain